MCLGYAAGDGGEGGSRFDRIVSVESPDRQGRMEILQVHINNRGLPLAGDVTLEGISAATVGFTGAELANLVNEAALLAGREVKLCLRTRRG